MTTSPSTRNVLRVFREATTEEISEGMAWYAEANRLAYELDSVNRRRAAAVIAVLSPQLSWPRNMEIARSAYVAFHRGESADSWVGKAAVRDPNNRKVILVPGTGAPCVKGNARKAADILWNHADPETVVSGPKVRAFWHAIVNPADPRCIVIDRHAIDVTLYRVTDDETRGALTRGRGAYDRLASCYIRAASILSREGALVTPVELQAITWTVWRVHHAKALHNGKGGKSA